jgi:hypothetical protein
VKISLRIQSNIAVRKRYYEGVRERLP